MMGKQRIRTNDGKWHDWEVVSQEEDTTGECPICSGRLRRKQQDGFVVIPIQAGPINYFVKENWIKLPPGQWACDQCRAIFQLTAIEKPVLIARKTSEEKTGSDNSSKFSGCGKNDIAR